MNRRIVILSLIILLLLVCSTQVSAYYLTLDAPAQVKVGEPINVNGTTNVPPPDKIDVVFSHQMNIPVEKARKSIQITEKGDNAFNVTFDTTGLEKGNYKIEGLSSSQRDFSVGSKSIRVVKLIDRSDLIKFTSQLWQEFDKKLIIEAKISDYTDNAIQMDVSKGSKKVFGPESIPVTRGVIKYELPIEEPGTYEISFTDYDGFIGKYNIVSEEKDIYSSQIDTEEPVVEQTREVSRTSEITPEPTIAQTPKPVKNEETEDTVVEDPKSISGVSTSAEVSRENPGYFLISSEKFPIIFKTSDNNDWVIEYKKSSKDAVVKVNDKIGDESEVVKIEEKEPEIYLKVYPYSFKKADKVTITADGAESVTLSDDAAKAFGAPPRYGEEKKETSFPIMAVFIGFVILSIIYVKKRE